MVRSGGYLRSKPTLAAAVYPWALAYAMLAGCGSRTSILDDDERDGAEGGRASLPSGTAGKLGSAGVTTVDPSLPSTPLTTPGWALGVAACPAVGNGVTGAGCDQLFACVRGTYRIHCEPSRDPVRPADNSCACQNPAGLTQSGYFGTSSTLCFDAGRLCVQ